MTVRVAVVGAGFIGADHAAAYAAQPDATLVGILDTDQARADVLAVRHGSGAFTDLDRLLAQARPHAASVCVPTGLHRQVVERLAAAGVHVLLEKPMAPTVPDCDAIADAARHAGIVLMLGLTHRFHAELLEARRLIEEGAIGRPMFAQDAFSFGEHGPWPAWYYDRAMSGGGELMHDGVHLVDRLQWLLDSPIVEVYGRTTTYARSIPGVEDGGVAVLAFEGGAIASLFVNEATHPLLSDAATVPMPGRLELEIHGSLGSIRYRTWHQLIVDLAGQPSRVVPRTDGDEMSREIREFLDAITERRPPIVGAREGRRGIAVIEAIYESERRRRPVLVDELFPSPT